MITTEPWPDNPKRSCYHVVCDICGDAWRLGLVWDPRRKEENHPFEIIKGGKFDREKVVCKTHSDKEIEKLFNRSETDQ